MNILIYTLRSIAYALTEPYLLIVLVILAFVLHRKNTQTVAMQKMIIGEKVNSSFELTISQIVIGIFAGTLASIIMSYLGIVFDQSSAVDLVFLASIVFMFFNPRFICFSYSGSIIGLLSVFLAMASSYFKIPDLDFLNIDVVSLMSMIAVLHFIEGILVMIDGKTGSIPIFTSKNGKIIGGFALKRYWIIPIAIFLAIQTKSISYYSWQVVSMPSWWPVLKGQTLSGILNNVVLILMPFYAVVGYSSVTFTKNTRQKSFMSGIIIMTYAVVIFILAQLASVNLFFKIFVLIMAPVAHEGMRIIQTYFETTGTPKYISSSEGIMVLAVAPNSPAHEMGIKSGDLLVEINNIKVESEDKIIEILNECSNFIWLKVKRVTGDFEQLTYNKMNSEKRLGIVFVPRNVPKNSMVVKLNKNKFSDILDKIKNNDEDD
ncbi:PDZ domain-containing protein [Clostridium sp. cel8]|uniref:PDZ domain-containing protein n=1 Tax=Clostridium sp. cel8 TaxID=2663123 RepID=UPI0015F73463|nr:PDZ domain-containing protein [Clostridium sp. cel8]MBA5850712.1 PDZ domain-containing protein [Clostridium sp. cel8]